MKKVSSTLALHEKPDATMYQEQMEVETRFHWIGPFPVHQFIDELLPIDGKVSPKSDYFHGIPKDGLEVNMYQSLVGPLFL